MPDSGVLSYSPAVFSHFDLLSLAIIGVCAYCPPPAHTPSNFYIFLAFDPHPASLRKLNTTFRKTNSRLITFFAFFLLLEKPWSSKQLQPRNCLLV